MSTTETPVRVTMPDMELIPVKTSAHIASKVGAGAFAGALAVLTVYAADAVFGVQIPAEPSVAIGTVYAFILGYIASS